MITIFTPTYNRSQYLGKLYKSLCEQSDKNFEWIVWDDGSTDTTSDVVNSFIGEGKLKVRYYKSSNGGKHRAINSGIHKAEGDWFFIVDSDDSLPKNSIATINQQISQLNDISKFCAVCGLKLFNETRKIAFNRIVNDDFVSFRKKFGISGDMAEVFRTNIIKEYPFPEFENEKFISEAIAWNRMAEKYICRFFPKDIYECEYLEDGLTRSIVKHFMDSPKGTMLYFNEIIKSRKMSVKSKIKAAINYWRYTPSVPAKDRVREFRPIWWSLIFKPVSKLFKVSL